VTTDATNLKALRHAQRAAGREFADRVADLVPAAEALVQAESALRIALAQAGVRDGRPPARELAVEILHGRLGCLRPYIPFCTSSSADRATEALTAPEGKPPRPEP
jgi:hypothetical protein